MKIAERGFQSLQILLAKSAANIQIESGQRRAVEHGTDAADNHEFQAAALKPGKQSLIILRHDRSLRPGWLTGSQLLAGAPLVSAQVLGPEHVQSATCRCRPPWPRARPARHRRGTSICH